MPTDRYRDHWLIGECFRPPMGGWRGLAVLVLAVLLVLWGIDWSFPIGSLGVLPIGAAEVLPEDRISMAAGLRLLGLAYLLALPLFWLVFV